MALDPVLFNVLVVLASLLIIFKAADLVVYGISRYARKLGLSDILIGLVVVALAASMPEIISSLTGLILGREEVLFGTILGTNMAHLALVLGVLALIGRKIRLESEFHGPSIWVLWLALLIPFALMLWDNELGRIDGLVLIVLYVVYLGWLWHREESSGHLKKRVLLKTIWRDALIFVLSLVAILLAGRWLVFSSINLASFAGIPAYFIALTVLAVGGALPDFAVGIRSIIRGRQDVGVGDLLGSVALEFLLFFGLIGLLHPLSINAAQIINAVVFLAVSLTLVIFFVQRRTMTWKHGALLVALYVAFLTIEISKLG